jgi:crotonobetainyl-CoA:carnitine CoA-transferase CaiB-like acyl-CoA transferase
MSRTTSEGRTTCEGWSVLEIGTGSTATSVAGMMLAENGARVLEVEPPDGDRLRRACPSGFLEWNRGKESLLADLTTDDGRAVVRDAARDADVLLAGAGPDVLRQWGLDADQILAELGHTSVEIDALKGARAVFGPDER